MTGTGISTHAVASPTAAQEVKSRSARRRHAVLRPEKGNISILTMYSCFECNFLILFYIHSWNHIGHVTAVLLAVSSSD